MIKQKKLNKKILFLSVFACVVFVLAFSYFMPLNLNYKTENLEVSGNIINATEMSSSSFEGGGTAINPYLISDTSDLVNLRVCVNSGTTFNNTYFILTNNISIPGSNIWQPIGNSSKTFNGIFDGNGYTISELKLSSSYSYNGLFGHIWNAKIVNLQLKNIQAIGTANQHTFLGGLAGFASGDCTLSNISVTNSKFTMNVSGIDNVINMGGLVGCSNASNLMIRNCNSSENNIGTSTSGSIYTGGIIGSAEYKIPGVLIQNCRSKNRELVSPDYKINIRIKDSYYSINSAYIYYGYDYKPSDTTYSVEYLFSQLNDHNPDIWYKDINEVLIRGVGNVDFKLNTSNANLNVSFPFSLGYNYKLKITADDEYMVSNATIYQRVYADAFIYDSSNFSNLKTKAQLGYLFKTSDKNTLDFNISDVFGKLANRQGYFSINLNLTQTSINVPIVKRYYDITSNSWQQLTTDSKNIKQDQTVNHSLVSSGNESYNYTYLNLITPNYYEFLKSGASTVAILSTNFVFTLQHIELIKSGYVLNVNYTNGFLFKAKVTPSISENYWLASTAMSIHKLNNNVFSAINLNETSPLILQNNNYDFVGWSKINSSEPIDFYGRVENLKYVPWKPEFTLQIKAVRANLTESNNNYNITGLELSSFADWNFNNYSSTNILTLYSVWGGDTIRLYTYVYSYFSGTYHLKSTLFIDSTAPLISDFYRLENNGSCSLSLKNLNGTILDLSNGGYLNIEWHVAEIRDNEIYYLMDEEGDGFGTLQVNSDDVTASFSGMTRQTSVIVVLEPKEDIGITLKLDGVEIEHEVSFKINGETVTPDDIRFILIYGEEYVITIENLPNGYHLAEVKITNDIDTNITFNSRERTCTFIVDFVDDIELTFTLAEGLLIELLIYIIAALSIVFLIIIIWLIVGNSVKRKNLDNSKPQPKEWL